VLYMAEGLWTVSERYGKRVLRLDLVQTVFLLQASLQAIYWLVVILACKGQFDCTQFFPSPGYLTVFGGIYRLGVWVCVGQGGLFLVINAGAFAASKGAAPDELRLTNFCMGIIAAGLLMLFPVFNDPNASQGHVWEYLAAAAYYGFVVLYGLWILIVCAVMRKSEGTLHVYWLKAIGCISLLALTQWLLAYTPQAGPGLNHTALGAASWLFTALFLCFPAVLAQRFPHFCLALSLPDPQSVQPL